MKVKVTRRYIADDGMEFSSKKAAAHHEADTFAQELGYTAEEYERAIGNPSDEGNSPAS